MRRTTSIEGALPFLGSYNAELGRFGFFLEELVGKLGETGLAQELFNAAVTNSQEPLTSQVGALEAFVAGSDRATQSLLGLTESLFQQAQALIENADSWQDWAKGALGAVETVLQAVLGAEGKGGGGGGGFGRIFDILGGFFGFGGGGGIVPGTPATAAIGPLSTGFGFASGGVPAIGLPRWSARRDQS